MSTAESDLRDKGFTDVTVDGPQATDVKDGVKHYFHIVQGSKRLRCIPFRAVTLDPDYKKINLHDRHRTPAPKVSPGSLVQALSNVIWCNLKEGVEVITRLECPA